MSDVFLCETGVLTNASKRDLRKAGVVVVEVTDPSKCQFIRATETVSADDMLWAAMDALRRDFDGYGNKGDKQREQLAHNLYHLIVNQRTRDGQFVTKPKEASS